MNTPAPSPTAVEQSVRCWCGNAQLVDFSPDYWRCADCETLVLRAMRGEEVSQVRDDEQDLYGKGYYLQHLQQDYGYPDLETRARADLPERCLHWLRTLLKYVPGPGARTLELGCGHGGFVAMQRWAGLDATGLELSPWLVDRARDWFGIPVLQGRLEDQGLPDGSLDAVVLMDVLEHLPTPRQTLGRAVALLRRPGGFLLIQTPSYPPGLSYEEMLACNHPFLAQFKPTEHLYLFSEGALARLCSQLGVGEVRFEPAIFAQYDQYAVASTGPLRERPKAELAPMLMAASPPARWTLALLDLGAERDAALSARTRAETDSAARLRQIETLTTLLSTSEADRAARGTQVEELTTLLATNEADRAARLRQVETLTALLATSEADRAARLENMEKLTALLHDAQQANGTTDNNAVRDGEKS